MDYLKKHKSKFMRAAMIVILYQFYALFLPFAIHDELKFSWFGMPTELSYWTFLGVSTLAFLIMAYFVGEHDKTDENNEEDKGTV